MEHEHFTYPEAIKYLAKKYNIEIEETEQTTEQKAEADKRESLYLVNEFARDYFKSTLTESQQGKAIGMTYFKERGFTLETIEKFQLGYNDDRWDGFTQEALRHGYQMSFLEETGLTIVKGDRQFDRFLCRVSSLVHGNSRSNTLRGGYVVIHRSHRIIMARMRDR